MNHLHPEEPLREYTRAELEIFGNRLTWGACVECGAELVTLMHGIDVFEVIKARGFDDMMIPTGNKNSKDGTYRCRACGRAKSESLDKRLKPRYSRQLLKSVKPIFKCPLCEDELGSKAEVFRHLIERHDRFAMEQKLHRRPTY